MAPDEDKPKRVEHKPNTVQKGLKTITLPFLTKYILSLVELNPWDGYTSEVDIMIVAYQE